MSASERAGEGEPTGARPAAGADLRCDVAPARDLWPAIAARIADGERPGRLAWLGSDCAPARELWPQIDARIDRRRRQRQRAPWLAAAAIAASVVVALSLEVVPNRPVAGGRVPVPATVEFSALSREPAAPSALRPAALQPMNPETRALLRANLKIVSNAEAQLKRARATDPDSAYLDSLLSSARQQKQDLRYALAER